MGSSIPRQRTLMTAEQLFNRGIMTDGKVELVRGHLVIGEPPGPYHGSTALQIGTSLNLHVRTHAPGGRVFVETGYILERGPDTVRGPDVSFVSRERMPEEKELYKFFNHAPDLAVEVLSPGDRRGETEEKVAEYFAAGVRIVWIADTKRKHVVVRTPDGASRTISASEMLDGGDVLPGYSALVGSFFD